MPKFKPGDRVLLTVDAIEKGYGYFSTRGVVLDVCADKIYVRSAGRCLWHPAARWLLDSAAVVGSAAWLERRAMTHLIVRD